MPQTVGMGLRRVQPSACPVAGWPAGHLDRRGSLRGPCRRAAAPSPPYRTQAVVRRWVGGDASRARVPGCRGTGGPMPFCDIDVRPGYERHVKQYRIRGRETGSQAPFNPLSVLSIVKSEPWLICSYEGAATQWLQGKFLDFQLVECIFLFLCSDVPCTLSTQQAKESVHDGSCSQ
jgi:hypothetical protein